MGSRVYRYCHGLTDLCHPILSPIFSLEVGGQFVKLLITIFYSLTYYRCSLGLSQQSPPFQKFHFHIVPSSFSFRPAKSKRSSGTLHLIRPHYFLCLPHPAASFPGIELPLRRMPFLIYVLYGGLGANFTKSILATGLQISQAHSSLS